MQRVAIAGATGYIGGRIAPQLLNAGYAVRCLVRSPGKLQGREWTLNSRVDIQQTDLSDAPALTRGLEGCEAAFYLVHSMMSAGVEYAQRDQDLAITFAQAARDANVRRIIYLGGLGEIGSDLSEHLASRREVEAALASGGVPVTVLRAAMIIGSGSASFEILRYLVQRLPIMITPKWVSTPCQPIAVQNVITYLVGVLSEPQTAGRVFDIGGSEILGYNDIMRVMAEELGLPRRLIIPVPVLSPRLSSYWIHLVTPLSHQIARPLAEGLKNSVVCREDRITRLIPQKLLNVREAIRAALSQVAAYANTCPEPLCAEALWYFKFQPPGAARGTLPIRGFGFATKREAEDAEAQRRIEQQQKYDLAKTGSGVVAALPKTLSLLLEEFLRQHAEEKLAPKMSATGSSYPVSIRSC